MEYPQLIKYALILACITILLTFVLISKHNNKTEIDEVNTSVEQEKITNRLPWGYSEYLFGGKVIIGEQRVMSLNILPKDTSDNIEDISRVVTTCGCVNASFKRIGKSLSEGIRVHAIIKAQAEGEEHQMIRLVSSEGKCIGAIKVIMHVIPKFSFYPDVIDFGSITPQSERLITVRIVSNVYKPSTWHIIDRPIWTSTSIITSQKINTNLICTINDQCIPGPLQSSIKIVPDDNTDDEVALQVIGYLKGMISSEPEILNIGPIQKGNKTVTNFKIRKQYSSIDFNDISFTTPSSNIEVKITNSRDSDELKCILFIKPSTSSIIKGDIIITDQYQHKLLRIPYRITII